MSPRGCERCVLIARISLLAALVGLEDEAGAGLVPAEGALIGGGIRKQRPLEAGCVLGNRLLPVLSADYREGTVADELVGAAGLDS